MKRRPERRRPGRRMRVPTRRTGVALGATARDRPVVWARGWWLPLARAFHGSVVIMGLARAGGEVEAETWVQLAPLNVQVSPNG